MKNQINLDQIRIASPCHARWEDMIGDDRARFCSQCQKNVFNFSALTSAEAEALIRATEGRLCGRFYQRPDGRMLTTDCPTGQRRRRNRVARWCRAAFAALVVFFGGGTALRSAEPRPEESVKQGKVTRAPANAPDQPMPMGEIVVQPPIMGDLCIPTNPPPRNTNPPATMGLIYVPPATNSSAAPQAPPADAK